MGAFRCVAYVFCVDSKYCQGCSYQCKQRCHRSFTSNHWSDAGRTRAFRAFFPDVRCVVTSVSTSFHSQLLEQSSANLRSTTAAHDTLSTLLSTSKHLITALEKSDWLDRLLILTAVAFFFLIVLFILKQRVVDKGIRIAFWWTRFIPDFGGDVELQKVNSLETSTAVTAATITTLFTGSSLLATTATFQVSTFKPDGDAAFSTLVPSGSDFPTPDVQRVNDAVQEILTSTAMPSSSLRFYETCTTQQKDSHQEL